MSTTAGTTGGFRSLADQLRSWPDDRLAALLAARPDLATPAPQDSGQLAARAATRASLVRALDDLDAFHLSVLALLVASGDTTPEALVEAAGPGASAVIDRLAGLALAWQSTSGLRAVSGVAEALLVRGETPGQAPPEPPALLTTVRDQSMVDRAAAGAAFELLHRAEVLLDGWGTAPAAALRGGGIGVRELRNIAGRLQTDDATAAVIAEVVVSAGLATTAADPSGSPAWMPTDLYDTWSERPAAERWTVLARAWLASPRMPGLVGTKDSAGKTWNLLAPELAGIFMAETRRMTLDALAALPPGQVLAGGTGAPSLVARLEWERPRRPRTHADQVAWTLTEAAVLGVSALGGLASYARPLLDGGSPVAALTPLLPEPVDHVLLQADLTAVAPGPLEPALGRRLQTVADVESRGGATVYRFTTDSVRRAMDAGWTATELHEFVAGVSRTPVPQPLTYLIDDTARTFGTVRVGYAEAFLRADDEHALAELLHHPQAARLGLRRIAPTVLVSTTPIDVLLPRLRELGVAPVIEAADGTVHVARPDALRARTPKEHRGGELRQTVREAARVSSVVTAIRAGDRVESSRPASARTQLTPSDALAVLREALDAQATVVIEYVDNQGTRGERVVDPRSVDGGQLIAFDHRVGDLRGFAVHRIVSVRPA